MSSKLPLSDMLSLYLTYYVMHACTSRAEAPANSSNTSSMSTLDSVDALGPHSPVDRASLSMAIAAKANAARELARRLEQEKQAVDSSGDTQVGDVLPCAAVLCRAVHDGMQQTCWVMLCLANAARQVESLQYQYHACDPRIQVF